MQHDKPKIICVTGPTCSGKTDIAYLLAKELKTEIISADSRQIYKELNIGTSKPPGEYLETIKHHFIDHLSIFESFDAARFKHEAEIIINKLHHNKKISIVAGGTGFYINALLYGLFEGPGQNIEIRNDLENDLNIKGLAHLFELLHKIDPVTADNIDGKNPRRVIRALEVFFSSGLTLSEHHKKQMKEDKFSYKIYFLNWDRKLLYDRINRRVDSMIESGLPEEVRNLMDISADTDINPLQTVGYKELIDHYNGKISFNDAVGLIKRNTRRYAKRQITFFNANKDINCLELKENLNLQSLVEKILKNYKIEEN